MATAMLRPKTKTRTIGDHEFSLTKGHRYRASRPMAVRGQIRFDVTIADITPTTAGAFPVAIVVRGLSYATANELLAAFNDGQCSHASRVWK